ncbi:hypothetical protein [Brevundimonas sp. Root1279]|uniref:hypothetical protein n=1 Tax=Brevundimonas sp. Root1279 TaxID=1736443 RepID=UPI0006F41EE2|nr:hypothetical protein [Brevundimonas sp. Root1279]KQW83154.1 hypothetical protein ASC65_07460 [Brevundimonas sp. Root1279]
MDRTRALKTLRWTLYGAWVVASALAMMMALTPGLDLLGLPPERISFIPATFTGMPWTLPLFFSDYDSVTTLAIVLVGQVLNVSIGLMLARGDD